MNDDAPQDEMDELVGEFLAESDGHLQILNEKLLLAEEAIKNGTEMAYDDLDAMFRGAHTIKGTASFMGLDKIVRLTHEMETVLQKVRARELALSSEIIDVLFAAFDVLGVLFKGLREKKEEVGDVEECVDRIKCVLGAGPTTQVVAEKEKAVNPQVVDESKEDKKDGNDGFIEQFIIETEQNVDDFNALLVAFEDKNNEFNPEKLNELFRNTHTIKGNSGVVNVTQVGEVAHNMENILSILRERGQKPEQDIVTVLFKGIDAIKDMLQMLKTPKGINSDVSGLCDELKGYFDKLSSETGKKVVDGASSEGMSERELASLTKLNDQQKIALSRAAGTGLTTYKVILLIEKSLSTKSLKIMLIKEKVEKKCQLISLFPDPDQLDKAPGDVNVGMVVCSAISENDLRGLLQVDGINIVSIETEKGQVKAVEVENTTQVSPAPAGGSMTKQASTAAADPGQAAKAAQKNAQAMEMSTIRIDSRKLDNLMNLSGELVIMRARFARLVNMFNDEIVRHNEICRLARDVRTRHEIVSKELRAVASKSDESSGIKTNIKKIAKALDDSTTSLASLDEILAKDAMLGKIRLLDETTSMLGKISSDIQSGVMQTRMIPIEGVFTRFKRIVRDLSKELGKEVNLKIEGEDTELDKKIVDSLGDPLTHMVRNALDHGIDDVESRRRLGKPDVGTLRLRASHKGNSIVIDVGDDGKGVDPQKMVAAALKKGVIGADQAERMSDKEKLHLMFMPGFSTAEKVTGLSGRGVGMDVVKNMINSVNGVVDIDTVVGHGTTFSLRIPLTLAIIQALLVIIGEDTYAFPLEAVTEVIKASKTDVYSIDGNSTVKLRDHALSIVNLEDVIRLKGKKRSELVDKKVVIINDGEFQLGVIVDELIGEEEIVIKSLSDHFSKVKGVAGASILADGQVALILDPVTIINEAR